MKAADVTGKRFGRLVAQRSIKVHGRIHWICVCDCGESTTVRYGNLGRCTTSCGCARVDACKARERRKCHPTHGRVLSYYKRNAKVRRLEWSLLEAQFTSLISDDCHYCGAPPDRRVLVGREIRFNGIDRVDPSRGYIQGNVVSCCWTCNTAKMAMSLAEFRSWVLRVAARMESV